MKHYFHFVHCMKTLRIKILLVIMNGRHVMNDVMTKDNRDIVNIINILDSKNIVSSNKGCLNLVNISNGKYADEIATYLLSVKGKGME